MKPQALNPSERISSAEKMMQEMVVTFSRTGQILQKRVDACVKDSIFQYLFFAEDGGYRRLIDNKGNLFEAARTLDAFTHTLNDAVLYLHTLDALNPLERYNRDFEDSLSRNYWVERTSPNEFSIVIIPAKEDSRIIFSGTFKTKIRLVYHFILKVLSEGSFGLRLEPSVIHRIRESYQVSGADKNFITIKSEYALQERISRLSGGNLLEPPRVLDFYYGKKAKKHVFMQTYFPLTLEDVKANNLFEFPVTGSLHQMYTFTPQYVFEIFGQLLRSIEEIHRQKHVHGDIRLANVLIQPDPFTVHLTDYGTCSHIGDEFERLATIFPQIDTLRHYGRLTEFTDYWGFFRIMMELLIGPSLHRTYYDEEHQIDVNFSGDRTSFIFHINALQKMLYHVTFKFFKDYWEKLKEQFPNLPGLPNTLQEFLHTIDQKHFTYQQYQDMQELLNTFCQFLQEPHKSNIGETVFALYEDFFKAIVSIHTVDLIKGFPFMEKSEDKKMLLKKLCEIWEAPLPKTDVDLSQHLDLGEITLKDLHDVFNTFRNQFEQLVSVL